MKKNLLGLFLIAAFVFPSALSAQMVTKKNSAAMKAAQEITAKQMSDYLYFIASDEMEGRDTPSRGLDTTAKFIGMNLSKWGFKPAGDNGTFYQKIALSRSSVDPASTSVEIGGQKYVYGDDVVRVSGNSPITNTPIVFAGNGWMIKSKNLNPYQNIDVKGKLVAVYGEGVPSNRALVPLPEGVKQTDLTGERGKDWADAVTYARMNGAVGVVVLPSKFLTENWSLITQNFGRSRVTVEKFAQPGAAGTGAGNAPTILIASQKLANALFSGEAGNPMSGAANSFDLNADKKISFTVAMKPETLYTQNVVAIWEGSDPTLKTEMVAVGAHYDHVGIGGCGMNNGDDRICNGADDDGSGTTGVLAMAEALAKSPVRPKRSILFVWHCGEEKGLWGSQYFNMFPTVDLKNVVAQLNIDMIGRSKKADDNEPKDKNLSGENAIYVIGSQMMSSQLGKTVADVNNSYLKLNYDLRYDDPKDPNRFFFRSDHFNYAQKGIPITFWFDGEHVDYHQAGDSPDKIDYNKMEKVARTIFLTMWEISDTKTRPAVDKQLPPELTQPR